MHIFYLIDTALKTSNFKGLINHREDLKTGCETEWIVKMEIFCSAYQHILPLLNHFPSFNSWLPPPLMTVCYSESGRAYCWQETSSVKQAEFTLHLLCLWFTLLQKQVEWVRLSMAALDTPLSNQPCAICKLSLSTQRHSHLCHTARCLV